MTEKLNEHAHIYTHKDTQPGAQDVQVWENQV